MCAADIPAIASGSWLAGSTWSGGAVPGVNDNALVGSTATGALAAATVNLTQNTTAGNLFLGRDANTSGTLDLGSFTFTGTDLYFGLGGANAVGAIVRTTGHIDVSRLDLRNGNAFTIAPADVVRNALHVFSGSTATLSANFSVADKINLANSGSVLNAAGFNITATNEILLGWDGVGAQIQNRGTLTTSNLIVRGQNFQLAAGDAVGRYILSAGSTTLGAGVAISRLDLRAAAAGATTATSNISAYVSVESGSTLTLGANLTLSDKLNIFGTGTIVNAASKDIAAASQILLGWDGGNPQLQNRAKLTTNELLVRGQNFDLTPTDAVNRLIMSAGATSLAVDVKVARLDLVQSAVGTTAVTSNITAYVSVESGSKLTLGANLTLSDKLNMFGTGTIVDAAGHHISAASQILLGWDGGNPQLQNRGNLASNELLVRGQTFQLTSADAINNFSLHTATSNLSTGVVVQRLDLRSNSVATIAATGNITRSISMETGSSLTLNANLTMTEYLNIAGAGTVFNANGRDITATGQFLFGWNGSGAPTFQNPGKVNVGELLQANGAQLALGSGQDSTGRIYLYGNSRLTVSSTGGTGLTLTRTQLSELDIQVGSKMTLVTDGNQMGGWVFRWANPNGGNHLNDLNTLIGQGKIDFMFQNSGGYTLSDMGGFTYVVIAPVPEPASILGLCAAACGIAGLLKKRRSMRA